MADSTAQDRAALVALYNATDGANWQTSTNWLTDRPIGEWHRVTVDGDGRVTQLDLSDNQLSGPIPAELGGLTNLELLNLGENQLRGPIPAELGDLTFLQALWLGGNELSGPIPAELGTLSHLQYLVLHDNQLGGPIPPELDGLTNLQYLLLHGNQLSGPIPPELGALSNLQGLSLSGNQLSGSIPPELGALSNLQGLSLSGNQLSGSIPPELGALSNLQGLSLSGNQLSGPIPAELGALSNLSFLHLYDNQLSGPIPAELGDLTNLSFLHLYDNQLSGPIPAELGGLTNLQELSLAGNELSGPIPAELGDLANLRELSLAGNELSGPVPAELGDLTELDLLDLAENQLSGPIPAELGGLTNLEGLWLFGNQLSGPIPVKLGQLVALTHVYLANNALTGCVPASLRSVSNNDLGSLGLEDCSTGTYLDPVPEAIDVGEELAFGVITDVKAPSTIRIGPGAGNTAVAISEDACPSAPALSEGGGRPYHYRDLSGFRSSGSLRLTGCAVGTTDIHIYQGTTLLQSYPVRVIERTLVALSDGAAGELVLTWSDATEGASTATGWQYRLRIWGREGDAPDDGAPWTWGNWTTIPGDGAVRRHRVTGLDEEWPYDFEVRPVAASGPGLASNIGEGVTPRVGADGIPRLNVGFLTATGFGWGGGLYGDQVLEGGRTYRLGDSDRVITIPAGMNMTVGLVGNDHLAGLIFSLEDVVTGNWVTLDFGFHEVERSIKPVEDGGDSAPDPNSLFDQMLNSIRVQPEPPAGGE